jgi:glycosyltransferase involved in cell wall biosynthesis
MRLKLTHVITGLSLGGAENSLYKLVSHLDRQKFDISIISLKNQGVFGERFDALGIPVYSCNFSVGVGGLLAPFKLARFLLKLRPDIVQTWLYHADLIAGIAAKLIGVKCIIWSIRTTDLKQGSWLTAVIRKLCALVSRVIPSKIVVVAHAARVKHIQLGYDELKMIVIPNGYDANQFKPDPVLVANLKNEIGIRQTDLVVGCVGRLSEDKGQDILIEASQDVLNKFPDVKFVFIGSGFENTNKVLVDSIASKSKLDRFILMGERNDVNTCFGLMDIFCLPSRTEGFPNVLAEAMLSKLPCVSSDCGDARLLSNGHVSIAKINDSMDLANKITQMLGLNTIERRILGQESCSHVSNEYSIDRMVTRYDSLFEQLN